MPDGRDVPVTVPHARDEECEACVVELEDFCGQMLRPGIEPPDAEFPRPHDCADRLRPVTAADVDAVAVPMPADRRPRVLEPFDRLDEFVPVLRVGAVEVKRRRMAEI